MNDHTDYHAEATDRLCQTDRIISTDAIMLPDGKLSTEHIDAVRQAIHEFTTDGDGVQKIPNNEIGVETGYSPSTISEFLNAKYKGDNSRIARHLNLWLHRRSDRKRMKGERPYISTWVCERMTSYVRLADRCQKMAAIVAPSGAGKDMVIEALAEEFNGAVIYCDTQTTATRLVHRIARAVGVKVTSSPEQVEQRVIEKMKGRQMVLFVNEAQTLAGRGKVGAKCAGLLRSIYDQTGVPICLFGSAEIFAFIDDRDPASGGGQLHRRCLKVNIMNLAQQTEDPDQPGAMGRPLFSKDEVKRFLASRQVKLADVDAFELLYQIANLTEHGTLGLCGDVISAIAGLLPDEAVTCDLIYEALSMQLDAELDIVRAKIKAGQDGGATRRRAMAG